MGYLDQLDVSRRALTPRRSRRKAPLTEHNRRKLVANIEEQIQPAKLRMAGRPLELRRRRGRRIAKVRPRIWWHVADDGRVGTYILFNKTAVDLAGRGGTIEVARFEDLPKAYETVIKATLAGELDLELERIAKRQT